MGAILRKVLPPVVQAIVGTAGHVDHGKTSLVRLLTGCETDRLPEEKLRGMSIDLGFAPCVLSGDDLGPQGAGGVVGIVDVPGHKDFIRNMVAGAASIDVLLLVVAADDGVMPQTAEHMQIVRLLRAPQVMVALTKIDMVSDDLREAARQDVAAFLSQVGFGDAPIIPVSNLTGEGIGEVRQMIGQLVARALEQRRRESGGGAKRAFRMNVERVFSVKGFGTVVTGIPTSGEIEVGAKACLLPAGRPAMVRTVQTYKQESSKAIANCCTAINVREIEAEQAARGMTLAWPDVYEPTQELVVTLENATGGPARGEAIELPRRFDAKFHAGTSAVDASVKLLESETLSSNTTCFAHLMLAEPVVLAAGDRFILRQLSPARTLGGGTVLSTQPQRFRRRESIGPRLQHAQASVREGDLATCQLLASPHALATQAQMERWTQAVPGPAAQAALAEAQHAGKAVNLEGGAWIALARVHEIQDRLARVLERYHATHRMTWGMEPAHVCAALDISVKNFAKLAELLCAAETMALRHGFLSLATFKPDITERQMRLRSQLLACLTAAGVSAPARGNLLKDLAIPEPDLRALEKLLLQEGAIVILDGNLMARDVFDRCRDILLKLFAQQPLVELATFRDATGTNRKMAVAMLDAFDATGLTRRSGAGRILAKPHRVTP